MSPDLRLDGRIVQVVPPDVPALRMDGPATAAHVLVPVAGPPGPRGLPGDGGHEHVQVVAQSVWTVPHDLGRYPVAWSLYDTDGRECDQYTVQHLDLNTSRVSMDIPTAGLIRMI